MNYLILLSLHYLNLITRKEVNLIRQYIDLANKTSTKTTMKDLPHLVQQAIEMRRDRLTRHGNIAELLGIPLAPRDGAPSLKPVEVKIRQPGPCPSPLEAV